MSYLNLNLVDLAVRGVVRDRTGGPNKVSPPTREAKQVKRKKEEDFTEILVHHPRLTKA